MRDPESDRIEKLCSLIAVEQDTHKFLALVEELNQLLNGKTAPSRDETRKLDDMDDTKHR